MHVGQLAGQYLTTQVTIADLGEHFSFLCQSIRREKATQRAKPSGDYWNWMGTMGPNRNSAQHPSLRRRAPAAIHLSLVKKGTFTFWPNRRGNLVDGFGGSGRQRSPKSVNTQPGALAMFRLIVIEMRNTENGNQFCNNALISLQE
jgi:hypothetical protein